MKQHPSISVHRRAAAAPLVLLAGAAGARVRTSRGSTAAGTWLCYDHLSLLRARVVLKMIRKIALRLVAVMLIVFMALNAYLAINRLRLIQKSAALTLESSAIQ